MTGELHQVADPQGLWPRLARFPIGSDPAAFERRLGARNAWSAGYTQRAIAEYRRFLYLASLADFEVTPSEAVDEVWHLHLEDGEHYRGSLCAGLLGRELRHLPGSGAPPEEERYRAQYRRTMNLYETIFGTAPADIWPSPAGAVVNGELEPRQVPDWAPLLAAFAMALGIGAALVGSPIPAALLFAGGGSAILFIYAARGFGRRRRRNADGSGGCGAGCSSADSDVGDGGASCGGGCGGGD